MIHDKVAFADTYRGISENLDRAIEVIGTTDFAHLENRKYQVSDGLYFIIMEIETSPCSGESNWEAHRDYIDIHVPVSGAERVGICHISELKEKKEYNDEEDVVFYNACSEGNFVTNREGEFVICFPSDGHLPGTAIGKVEKIRKAVIKVRV